MVKLQICLILSELENKCNLMKKKPHQKVETIEPVIKNIEYLKLINS